MRAIVTATVRSPWATTRLLSVFVPMSTACWPATVALRCEVAVDRRAATVAATRSFAESASL